MRLIRTGLLAVLILLALPLAALAQGPRVLILPFDMHANVDISRTRRAVMDALAAALSAGGAEIVGLDRVKVLVLEKGAAGFTEKDAFEIAGKARADFAVLGSITRLGSTTDVSWRAVSVAHKEAVAFYYAGSVSERALLESVKEKAALLGGVMAASLKAQPAEKKGVIDRIFITGNHRVDAEAIARRLTSREGEEYSPDSVREDIRSVYGTGYFDDVSASLSDTASGKMLTFHVVEMPFVRSIEFKGNDEVKEEKISSVITLKEN
ncbi:MAG: hypothetical protein BMS9Abin24_003 [Thermodesulfobacteriota bacterium]|nr:MAG: hypothetical protein BMS9Abin24_003 [Thermodesulfobacteriota bacterium]